MINLIRSNLVMSKAGEHSLAQNMFTVNPNLIIYFSVGLRVTL